MQIENNGGGIVLTLFILHGQDCVIIYDVYNRLPHMHKAMASYDGKYSNFLHEKYTNELAVRLC